MGQNASSRIRPGDRNHQRTSPTIGVSPPDSTVPDEHTTPSQDAATADVNDAPSPKRTRRSSIRHSLRNLVSSTSSSSVRSRVGSSVSSNTGSSPTTPSRRRWRMSRRWSKAPAASSDTPDPGEPDGPLLSPENPPEVDSDAPAHTVSTLSEKGKEKEPDLSHCPPSSERNKSDRPPTPFPASTSGPSATTSESPSDPSTGAGLSNVEQETSSNIGTWLGGQGQLAQRLGISQDRSSEDEVVISPSYGRESTDHPSTTGTEDDETGIYVDPRRYVDPYQPYISPESPLQPPPQPARRFPPPGTLVVVQGVVHTTDVSRPSDPPSNSGDREATPTTTSPSSNNGATLASHGARISPSTPRPSTPSTERGRRGRLSALMGRSASTPSSRQASRTRDAASINANMPSNYSAVSDSSPETEASFNLDGDTSPDSDDSVPSRESSDTGTAPSEQGARPGALSPSSIDVLGTLLSVAAAATAASLLTGSSDPIFSSGLTPPPGTNVNSGAFGASPIPQPGSQFNPHRPMSPTPTAGLGNIGFPGLGLGNGMGAVPTESFSQSQGGSRERVSRAWGSLRERLGLRATNSPTGNASDGATGAIPRMRPDGTPMNARELMLAEMARAFTHGLGLNEDGGDNLHENQSPPPFSEESASGEEEHPLPPEDSFERFLINLQADLRVALSGDPPPATNTSDSRAQNVTTSPSEPAMGGDIPAGSDSMSTPTEAEHPSVSSVEGLFQTTPSLERNDEMPPLADGSDTGSDFDEVNTSRLEHEIREAIDNLEQPNELPENVSPPQFPQATEAETTTPGSTSRTERRPGGGINWWRLYRFPPIPAPQVQGLLATLRGNTNNTSTNSAASDPAGGSFPTATPTPHFTGMASPSYTAPFPSSSEQTTQPPPAQAADSTMSNVVIPVIVVGLQTVGIGRRHNGRQASEGDPPDGFTGDEDLEDDHDFNGSPDDAHAAGRERTWHSRAADALRNLRPGRRAPSHGPQPSEGSGSRTFLIYVIGGYYPPDHTILNGANTMNSFEALWELAELLGNHKPPTVSKEEIEKSGLEIIKTTQIDRYEREGKISSNCIDKCLICLDDYDLEDEIRLLSCRHAFHKNCVDKWLETGRNNCPACRSTGVSTDGPPSTHNVPSPA